MARRPAATPSNGGLKGPSLRTEAGIRQAVDAGRQAVQTLLDAARALLTL